MLARCGKERLWHWAHKGQRKCDPWWENETPWHRDWKAEFPQDWTEIVCQTDAGERHIADVKTPSGLILEFQHSNLDEKERLSREAFYKKLIWIVDGKRLKKDGKIIEALESGRKIASRPADSIVNGNYYQITKRWSASSMPVILDFADDNLWCIAPKKHNWQFFAVAVSREELCGSILMGGLPESMQHLLAAYGHS